MILNLWFILEKWGFTDAFYIKYPQNKTKLMLHSFDNMGILFCYEATFLTAFMLRCQRGFFFISVYNIHTF